MKQPMFRAGKVIDMAIQIEDQGMAFYDNCVDSALGDKLADVFNFLIGEETKHIAIFSSMKDKIKENSLVVLQTTSFRPLRIWPISKPTCALMHLASSQKTGPT